MGVTYPENSKLFGQPPVSSCKRGGLHLKVQDHHAKYFLFSHLNLSDSKLGTNKFNQRCKNNGPSRTRPLVELPYTVSILEWDVLSPQLHPEYTYDTFAGSVIVKTRCIID